MKLASILRASNITGWRRHQPLPGRPDFIFKNVRLAVFVDGCFWHGCPKHGRKPDSNRAYWLPKLRRNRERDHEATALLARAGWTVLRLWEHQLREPQKVEALVRQSLTHALARLRRRKK